MTLSRGASRRARPLDTRPGCRRVPRPRRPGPTFGQLGKRRAALLRLRGSDAFPRGRGGPLRRAARFLPRLRLYLESSEPPRRVPCARPLRHRRHAPDREGHPSDRAVYLAGGHVVVDYAIVGLRRGRRPAEAGLKYFILGSFSSAIFLYGAALANGATGSTRLADVAAAPARRRSAGLLLAALRSDAARVGIRVQGGGGAVPHVGPGRVRGRAGDGDRFMAEGVKAAAFATLVRTLRGFGTRPALGPRGWAMMAWLAVLTTLREPARHSGSEREAHAA